MPNHVTTILTATDPKVLGTLVHTVTAQEQFEENEKSRKEFPFFGAEKKLEEFEDKKIVDFAQVIPMPARMFEGGCDGKHPHPHPDGGVYDYCWYGWNQNNWGTKWNAYSAEISDDLLTVQFDTAWAHPDPVIEALSKSFPDEPILVKYADEDLGSNLGEYTILNGEIIDDATPGDPAGRLDFAAMVKYGQTYAALKAEWGEED